MGGLEQAMYRYREGGRRFCHDLFLGKRLCFLMRPGTGFDSVSSGLDRMRRIDGRFAVECERK